MSRLRRLDDRFERRVEKMLPGLRGRSPWAGLIGVGVAYVAVSTVLLFVALLTDYDASFPATYLPIGIVALTLGIVLNRRWQKRHSE